MTLRAWHVNWLRTSLLLFSRHPMHSFSRAATLLPVDFLSQLKCLWPCRMNVNCYTNAPLPLHPHISGHCRMRSFTFHFRSLLALRQATPWSLGKMGWFPYLAAKAYNSPRLTCVSQQNEKQSAMLQSGGQVQHPSLYHNRDCSRIYSRFTLIRVGEDKLLPSDIK